MGKKVEVDYQVLEDAIQEMNDAKDEFHSCVENGFKTELENLDSMNSDFVDKLTRVLEISKKWNMDTLETNMEQYIEDADKIKQNIKEMDEKLAEKCRSENRGGKTNRDHGERI